MQKTIEFNITKKVKVENTPFETIIYIFNDRSDVLVEDLRTGKSSIISSYDVDKYLKIDKTQTPWIPSFNKTYIKFSNNQLQKFMPLYYEKNRNEILSFAINKNFLPRFETKRVPVPTDMPHFQNHNNTQFIHMINNNIPEDLSDDELQKVLSKNYKHLYKNVKEFEVENFKLEMVDTKYRDIVDENFNYLKQPQITCRLPLFQIYTILSPRIITFGNCQTSYSYYFHNIFMKIDDKFYRFPYGNVGIDDRICIGSLKYESDEREESIQDIAYAHLVVTEFNGDYNAHLKYNNLVPTTFDIKLLREQINNNNFELSFMDALFYLSQCKSPDEVNKNIFLLTTNIPKEILEFENSKQIAVTVEASTAEQNQFVVVDHDNIQPTEVTVFNEVAPIDEIRVANITELPPINDPSRPRIRTRVEHVLTTNFTGTHDQIQFIADTLRPMVETIQTNDPINDARVETLNEVENVET